MNFSDDLLIAYINGELAEPARAAVDRALVAGRSLAEVGDSAVGRAVAAVAEVLVPLPQAAKSR